MTQEHKELLLKDLCARLPYGVKLQKTYDTSEPAELYSIDLEHNTVKFYKYKGEALTICDAGFIEKYGKLRFKPYLFPLSSMTEEQRKEYDSIIYHSVELHYDRYYEVIDVDSFKELQDFYHINHLDYRGLIPMDLAIDATNLNVY